MKTYKGKREQNGGEAAKDAKRTRVWYGALIGIAVIIVALSVTLAVVFSNPGETIPVDKPGPGPGGEVIVDPPVVTDPIYFAPVEGGVVRESALNSLVYMPSLNMWKTHNGIDFDATEGASVMSLTDGTVKSVQTTTLEGVVVTIEHEGGLVSVYKSLLEASVKEGEAVAGGTVIGTAGTMMTEASDGIHVHFELLVNGEYVDPLDYVDVEILK